MIRTKKIYLALVFMVTFVMTLAVCVLFPDCAKAATVSEDGEYNLHIQAWNGNYINGKSECIVSFDFAEGEETVSIEELTKDLDIFSAGRAFKGWTHYGNSITELKKSDFNPNSFVIVGDKEIPNCYSISADIEYEYPVGSGTYYLVINPNVGSINGKQVEIIQAPSSEFPTVDLTKYVPDGMQGYSFCGWSVDGKKMLTSISTEAFKNAGKDAVTVTGIWRKDTFDEDAKYNFVLDANGGTIDGETSKLFNWFGGADSNGPCYLYGYVPVKEGATFLGWNTRADGEGEKVTALNEWRMNDPQSSGFDTDEAGNLKLYAKWEEGWTGTKTFTIFYTMPVYMGPATGTGDINGETEVQATVELTKGQAVDVYQVFEENGFKAFFEGKKFVKWVKSEDGKWDSGFEDFTTLTTADFGTVVFGSGENEKKVKDAVLLSAVFDSEGGYENEDYYYISLNPYRGKLDDGGTLKSIVNIIVPKSEFTTVDLTKYVPVTDEGYVFSGWYISSRGEEYGFINLAYKTEITKDDFEGNYIYAYGAVVEENPSQGNFVIRFDATGGTIHGAASKDYGYVGPHSGYQMYFEGLVPERSGYKFTGWNTKSDGTGKNTTALFWANWYPEFWERDTWFDVDGDTLTLYATWEKASVKGDVDLSGKVDIADLRLMLRKVCGKVDLTAAQIEAGDIAGEGSSDQPDGKISIADLRKLLRFICGKIEVL